jgi:hypothetical protein
MTRPPLLVPALAIAALLAAAPVAASPTAEPEAPIISIDFKLAASNGLHAHVEAFNAGGAILEIIARGGRSASYGVEGEITEAGLKAQFGALGLIEVAFTPTKTLETIKPAKGCKGEPSTSREGLFVGTIEFTGEREYVRVEATQAKGTMEVERGSEWQCPPWHELLARPSSSPRPSARSSRRQSKAKKGWATLLAKSHRCRCSFGVIAFRNRKGRGLTIFGGEKREEREGMEIVRQAAANARPSAFVFDHAAGTARVNPPPPFSGSGFFKRRPHRRDLWRSTIQVPLLGADPLSIRGRDFRARLIPGFPGSGE